MNEDDFMKMEEEELVKKRSSTFEGSQYLKNYRHRDLMDHFTKKKCNFKNYLENETHNKERGIHEIKTYLKSSDTPDSNSFAYRIV